MSQNLPEVVLVHGAWHVPAHYRAFIDALKERGFNVHCPPLPSCNEVRPANTDLSDDIRVIRDVVTPLAGNGHKIIAIMHSYGGIVGTEALYDLSFRRRDKNSFGGIIHLVYMCAFLPQVGETVATLSHADPSPIQLTEDGTSSIDDPENLFYNDLSPEERRKNTSMLVKQSAKTFTQSPTHVAWKQMPSSYLYCLRDGALWYDWQKNMVQAVKDAGGVIAEETYDSGHSPYLSMQREMVDAVVRVSKKSLNALNTEL